MNVFLWSLCRDCIFKCVNNSINLNILSILLIANPKIAPATLLSEIYISTIEGHEADIEEASEEYSMGYNCDHLKIDKWVITVLA